MAAMGSFGSARLPPASKCYQAALLSRSGFEDIDGDDDIREKFLCPFFSEYFDIFGLCCHLDEEHPLEGKNGSKRKLRKGGLYSALSLLRKELREGNLQSLFGGSSCFVSLSNAVPDPLLSSFILPLADELLVLSLDFLVRQGQPRKARMRLYLEEIWRPLPRPSRTKRRQQKDTSLSKGYCWALYLMTIYEEGSL